MDPTDASRAGAIEPSGLDPSARFRTMAVALFTVSAVVTGIVGLIIGLAAPAPRVAALLPLVVAPLTVCLYLAVAWGLVARRSWADPAAVGLLWWLVVSGTIDVVAGAARGTLVIPLGGIAAVVTLAQRPRGLRRRSLDWVARRVVAVLVVAWAGVVIWPWAAAYLVTPGNSPLVVASDALELSLDVDCDAPDAPLDEGHAEKLGLASRPRTLVVVRWRWLAQEVAPGGADGLVIRWWSDLDDSSSFAYAGDHLEVPGWVHQGCSSPACTLTEREAVPWWSSRELEIDVDAAGLRDGVVSLTLVPTSETAAPHQLQVDAAYAHLDRWLRWADPATCAIGEGG